MLNSNNNGHKPNMAKTIANILVGYTAEMFWTAGLIFFLALITYILWWFLK